MSTVTVDLSKATPITPNAAPPTPAVDMSKAQPLSQPTAQASTLPGAGGDDPYSQFSTGMYKSLRSGLGGILDMIAAPTRWGRDASDPEDFASRAGKHIQDAAQWLRSDSEPQGFWENTGAIGEQALELIGTDGLLKLAGGTAAAGKAVESTQRLKQAQQVAETLKSNPRLAGIVSIGLKAAKDAITLGAQTYAHTEDPTQAAISGVTGGAISGGVGALAKYVESIAPKTIKIGSEEVPALRSQLNERGLPNDTGAAGAPKIGEAQQQTAQNVIRNSAQQATAKALDRVVQSRPAFNPTEDATRMLEAGQGAEPFTFKLEGPGAVEGTEGDLTSRAKPIPREDTSLPADRTGATEYSRVGTEPEYIRPGGGDAIAQRTGRVWAERRIPGYLNPGADVEGASDVARGGGNLETTDPNQAEAWLRQIEDIQQSPEHDKLPEAQQAAIEDQRQQLSEQLSTYHSSPYAQRFVPPNIWDHIEGVRTFGDAATQIESVAQPVYATLDRVSGGEFNKWKEAAKQAQAIMRRSTTVEAYDGAAAKLKEAQSKIGDIIDSHRGAVSLGDYTTAKNAWRDASRLDELHSVFERMMNGVTAEESDQGFTRVMTGRAKQLQNYLDEGTNRQQIEDLIGKDGVSNLKQITLLLSKANTSRAAQDVGRNVLSEIYAHARVGGVGGLIGGEVARALNLPWYEGMVAGASAAGGIRQILRIAATSPRVGKMVEHAATNGIRPQIYAPLIARTILEPFEHQAEPEAGSEEPQP